MAKTEGENSIRDGMVDTNVLIYACAHPRNDPLHRSLCEKSTILVKQLEIVRLSAITWMEYQRRAKPHEQERLRSFYTKLRVLSVDARIAQVAIDLIDRRGDKKEKFCSECLSAVAWAPCSACGRNKSAQQRLNDALVVATAECTGDVKTLYSFDGGVLSLGKHARDCIVRDPPNVHGDLWDPKVNPAFAAAAAAATAVTNPPGTVVPLPKK